MKAKVQETLMKTSQSLAGSLVKYMQVRVIIRGSLRSQKLNVKINPR